MAVRDGMANAVARYAVALVPATGPTIGSGVLVSHGTDLFVATAEHVADALDLDDIRCIPKPPQPVNIIEHRDERYRHLIRPDLADTVAFRLPVANVLADAAADVALLRLNGHPAEFRSMEFYPLERARSTELPHDRVVVCGFPFDLTLVFRPTRQSAVFSRTLWGKLTTTVRENFDPDRQLLITYEVDEVMDGHGMSGGGVWMPPRPGTDLWNPDDQILVGLQIGCFEKTAGRPLVATRIERVRRLLVK
ncbi:MAG TPA: trypsin-like peptidase domain-containing protein [bacterium]|nr:trypsin-like peptidase domain-containing protein [bacterium]